MIQYDEQAARLANDDEFEKMQKTWLLDYISQHLGWQFVECFLKRFDSTMNAELENLGFLRSNTGVKLDNDKLKNLKNKYVELRNVWRDPGLIKIVHNDIQGAHSCLFQLEKKLKVTNKGNRLSLPNSRSQARRNDIKEMSDTAVFLVIKDRFKIRYGRGGVKKFETFVETKILPDKELCNFLFGGKGKPPEHFEEFKKIRKNSQKKLRKAREKIPSYRRMYETQDRIAAIRFKKPE